MQKTKGGRMEETITIRLNSNFFFHDLKGKVGDSYPDDMSPCHEFVCTAVSKKAAAWIKFPAL